MFKDYEDFDIANEDGVLAEFLGIVINTNKVRQAVKKLF